MNRRTAILAFVAVFFGGQLTLVVWSYFRGDRLGGYQMFAETTFFNARLYRITADGERVLAQGGVWTAPGSNGAPKQYRWGQYVDDFRLDHLQARTRAKIGIEVTLKFFQAALDHVAQNIPEDRETLRLELVVEYDTASGRHHERTLTSRERPQAAPGTSPASPHSERP